MNQSNFTIECWGCGKSLTRPFNDIFTFEHQIQQLIVEEGWTRREFGPNANPWFCGTQCAYHSHAAIQCRNWWDNYERRAFIKTITLVILTMIGVLAAIFLFAHLIGG